MCPGGTLFNNVDCVDVGAEPLSSIVGERLRHSDPAARVCACPNVLTWIDRAFARVRFTASKDVSMERLVSCPANILHNSVADFCDWQGAATSNSGAIARSRNAAKREKTQRIMQDIGGTGHQYWRNSPAVNRVPRGCVGSPNASAFRTREARPVGVRIAPRRFESTPTCSTNPDESSRRRRRTVNPR